MAPNLRKLRAGTAQRARFKPKLRTLKTTAKRTRIVSPKPEVPDITRSTKKIKAKPVDAKPKAKEKEKPKSVPPKPTRPSFESILLRHLTEKQRGQFSKDFREKINKLGKSLIELAAVKKEFRDTDAKVAQLEETYGRTMKIQNVWQYQERAGLAAVLGMDPQSIMNTPHVFRDEHRLLYNSAYPRNRHRSPEKFASPSTSSRSASQPPPRARTRSQLHAEQIKKFGLSTSDDED
ncbi:uncharacterized protein LOC129588405 [Paramacrobiotus metropolitanus]|uniref:uncharacterized protein LOC129588405 n=1 Tax=Paramacrobiotus metropolitanus TaxID=2943436 RepID=UPI002445675A|nr:uncharacterized protein LOC129588405 [Paramacrobiotus metropolitanus]